jgi:S1-C subfamily serine protease
MFQQACEIYQNLYTVVRSRQETGNGSLVSGMGCFVAPSLVLTANHIHQECQKSSDELMAISAQGAAFALSLVWKHDIADVALFRVVETISHSSRSSHPPARYPKIGPKIERGMSIGYLARIHRNNDMGNHESHLAFFSACASIYFSKGDFAAKWLLSGGFVEAGFSGGPAFHLNGDLMGVVIGSAQFQSQDAHRLVNVFCAPLVSPVAGIEKTIQQYLTD